jgi:hypothetical protein
MTPDEARASAERMAREPFFLAWVERATKDTDLNLRSALSQLGKGKTHEDLLRLQGWHEAVDDLVAAVRKGKI